MLNNFSIKPIIQFFNKKLKRDPKLKGSLKIERRRKLCVEKDFHSDTYVADTGAGDEHHKTDELLSGSDLENRVYSHNKNKRASLYSDFGDVDLNFVVDEDLYFADKDEDISFESDTDSNDDDAANYKEFLQEDVRENEDEIFQELIAEVGSVSVPTRRAPTVEYESLGSLGLEIEDLSHDDEEEQCRDDILELQGVQISKEVSDTILIPELPARAANIHETTILNDESKICERTVKTGSAGEAGPEYEECSELSEQQELLSEQNSDEQNHAAQSGHYSQADNSSIVKECLEDPDAQSDIKEVSTFMNAKDDHGSTEIISHAKSVTDLESGDHARPSSLDISTQAQATKHTEQSTNETNSKGHEESNNTSLPDPVLVNTPEISSESNEKVLLFIPGDDSDGIQQSSEIETSNEVTPVTQRQESSSESTSMDNGYSIPGDESVGIKQWSSNEKEEDSVTAAFETFLDKKPDSVSESNDRVSPSVLENEDLIPEDDSKFTNCSGNETGLAEEKENELIVKSSHGSDYSDETHINPVSVSETDTQCAVLLAGPVSTQV